VQHEDRDRARTAGSLEPAPLLATRTLFGERVIALVVDCPPVDLTWVSGAGVGSPVRSPGVTSTPALKNRAGR
jgi:hypothetical protein